MEFDMSLKVSVDDNTEETYMELSMDTPQGTQTYEYCGDTFLETLNDLYDDVLCDLIEMSKKKKEEESKPDPKEYQDLIAEIDALTEKINNYTDKLKAYNKKKYYTYSEDDIKYLYRLLNF